MDSDTPNHPTSRRVIRKLGNEGFGALVRLWCFAAQYGKGDPGRCVDSDGDPVRVEDLVDASGLSVDGFNDLVEVLLDTKCIDLEAWASRQEVSFPGMTTRADEYTKQVRRNNIRSLSGYSTNKNQETLPTVHNKTVQNKTKKESEVPGYDHAIMGWWNDLTHLPIPRCRGLNVKRMKACQRLMEQFDDETIKKAFLIIDGSKFCRGENERGWRASFDWILRPDSILRTLEGKYEDRVKAGTARSVSGKYDNVERSVSHRDSIEGK